MNKNLGKSGLICRFKPLHNGGYTFLEASCNNSDHVVIGIGSSNKYNLRNPFTAEESEAMIRESLLPKYNNFSIIKIPDFGHVKRYSDGSKWKEFVGKEFKGIDNFVTSNDYVAGLLSDLFPVIPTTDIIERKDYVKLRSTEIRYAMAKGEDWHKFVPDPVAEYIKSNGLDQRFRNEFGLETIAKLAIGFSLNELKINEQEYTWEK